MTEMKTREFVEAMSDEDRIIKTAELCGGWKIVPYVDVPHGRYEGCFSALKLVTHIGFLPDYLNSLDVMHAATKKMPPLYWDNLCHVTRTPWLKCGHFDYADLSAIANATARQRNTAFLMVML